MILLDGKKTAQKIKDELKQKAARYVQKAKLVIIQVGDNQASNTYVRNKIKACEYVGIEHELKKYPESVKTDDLWGDIQLLNRDPDVTGIMVQLPLPYHIDDQEVLQAIDPLKDVDGFTYENLGSVLSGDWKRYNCPATPSGILWLLEENHIDLEGKECVIVGRSNIVGKPMIHLLLDRNATVTIAHSHTKNLKEVCKRADVLIVAIGQPKMINREYVKEGAVVIDVGINRDENGKLCGDVDFDDVKDIVSAITPVPGGVGPMTVAMLLYNTYFHSLY